MQMYDLMFCFSSNWFLFYYTCIRTHLNSHKQLTVVLSKNKAFFKKKNVQYTQTGSPRSPAILPLVPITQNKTTTQIGSIKERSFFDRIHIARQWFVLDCFVRFVYKLYAVCSLGMVEIWAKTKKQNRIEE